MALLLAHAAATWFMVGLIWFVQVVHYPLFDGVGDEGAVAYAAAHQRQTGWVVGPVMLLEAATAAALVLVPPAGVPAALAWAGAGLLALVWLSTALLQVPLHARLVAGPDRGAVRALVRGNWVRTLAWSARGGVALWLLAG